MKETNLTMGSSIQNNESATSSHSNQNVTVARRGLGRGRSKRGRGRGRPTIIARSNKLYRKEKESNMDLQKNAEILPMASISALLPQFFGANSSNLIDNDGQDHKGSTYKSNTQFERYKDAEEELKVDDDDLDEEAKKPVKARRAYNSSKKKDLSDYEPSY